MTIIVAEIGINHNGSLEMCRKLMDAARWAGADYVKFQKRTVDIVYAGHLEDHRESPWGNTLGDQKRGLELDETDYKAIQWHSEAIGLPWFASAWDIPSLHFLRQFNLPFNKIASAMVTNDEFVGAIAAEPQPVIMSTAMCTFSDINYALRMLNGKEVTIMHCVGTYPCLEEELNLKMITELKRRYPDNRIGYSGHEASVSPSVVAAALGAEVIERHITLDRSMYGSDQAASLEPHGFKTMVDQIRKLPEIMGDGVKRITSDEAKVAKKLRYWL